MIAFLSFVITCILTSFFYFPIEFSFLPGINTKMILAVIGILFFVMTELQRKEFRIHRDLLIIVVFAIIVSILGTLSMVVNGTNDTAYATYIISMLVWLSSAYCVCCIIKIVEGNLSIRSVFTYVTIVCVVQCVLALLIDNYPGIKSFVDAYINQDQLFLNKVDRLYGIGASLDTAGARFSACLVMIAVLANEQSTENRFVSYLYLLAFVFISIIGNMIARTTSVGVLLGVGYLMLMTLGRRNGFLVIRRLITILVVAVPICFLLYNNNSEFRQLLRFGFEGFFSLFEEGEWAVSSNEKLQTMVVFPETLKTWIIGDGYFDSPNSDMSFLGELTNSGYYMDTDIGYLRFIFYFGLMGLFSFIFFFFVIARVCCKFYPSYGLSIVLILVVGLIVWLKVSTDMFLVFALFLATGFVNYTDDDHKIDSNTSNELT